MIAKQYINHTLMKCKNRKCTEFSVSHNTPYKFYLASAQASLVGFPWGRAVCPTSPLCKWTKYSSIRHKSSKYANHSSTKNINRFCADILKNIKIVIFKVIITQDDWKFSANAFTSSSAYVHAVNIFLGNKHLKTWKRYKICLYRW